MIEIAHRANYNGITLDENSPNKIHFLLSKDVACEIDVWYIDNKWWLGHDSPIYNVDLEFIVNDKLWLHCKNKDALYQMIKYNVSNNFFFHNNDEYVLTSNRFIWTYPGNEDSDKSIIVVLDEGQLESNRTKNWYGICHDWITL